MPSYEKEDLLSLSSRPFSPRPRLTRADFKGKGHIVSHLRPGGGRRMKLFPPIPIPFSLHLLQSSRKREEKTSFIRLRVNFKFALFSSFGTLEIIFRAFSVPHHTRNTAVYFENFYESCILDSSPSFIFFPPSQDVKSHAKLCQ